MRGASRCQAQTPPRRRAAPAPGAADYIPSPSTVIGNPSTHEASEQELGDALSPIVDTPQIRAAASVGAFDVDLAVLDILGAFVSAPAEGHGDGLSGKDHGQTLCARKVRKFSALGATVQRMCRPA